MAAPTHMNATVHRACGTPCQAHRVRMEEGCEPKRSCTDRPADSVKRTLPDLSSDHRKKRKLLLGENKTSLSVEVS